MKAPKLGGPSGTDPGPGQAEVSLASCSGEWMAEKGALLLLRAISA